MYYYYNFICLLHVLLNVMTIIDFYYLYFLLLHKNDQSCIRKTIR